MGVSGAHLAFRSFQQAWAFGRSTPSCARSRAWAPTATCARSRCPTAASSGAAAWSIATGVDYRRLDVPELEALVGRGVYYGAAVAEAPSMTGQEVYVVGGGNSAGQAALHLARYARHVTLLVRGTVAGREHVGLPHRPAGSHPQRRRSATGRPCWAGARPTAASPA